MMLRCNMFRKSFAITSLREEHLAERVAEVRPKLAKGREIAGRAEPEGSESRGERGLRRVHVQGPRQQAPESARVRDVCRVDLADDVEPLNLAVAERVVFQDIRIGCRNTSHRLSGPCSMGVEGSFGHHRYHLEGRSQSEASREYGVSQPWISRLLARYRAEGEAAFEPRSRRPHTSPARLAQSSIDLIIELREKLSGNGLDNGPHTIAWHLQHHHGVTVSAATISRHLHAAGLVQPAAGQAAQGLLRSLCRRPTQRALAGRLHPLVAGRPDSRGDLVLDR